MDKVLEVEQELQRVEVAGKQEVFITFLKKLVERAERNEMQIESMTLNNQDHMEILSGRKSTTSTITISTRSQTE